MNRAPRKIKRERKGPFVKPRAPAVPKVILYQELGCSSSATPAPWRGYSSFLDMCEMTNLRNEDGTRTDLELAVRRFHNLPVPEDE